MRDLTTGVLTPKGPTKGFDPLGIGGHRASTIPCNDAAAPAVMDFPRIATLAHQAGAQIRVENTRATLLNCKPIGLGADLVAKALTRTSRAISTRSSARFPCDAALIAPL